MDPVGREPYSKMTDTGETINIFKAHSCSRKEVQNIRIQIEDELPLVPRTKTRDDAVKQFNSQAKMLADALWAALPGGTLNALLIEMLDRQRSLLIVQPFNK